MLFTTALGFVFSRLEGLDLSLDVFKCSPMRWCGEREGSAPAAKFRRVRFLGVDSNLPSPFFSVTVGSGLFTGTDLRLSLFWRKTSKPPNYPDIPFTTVLTSFLVGGGFSGASDMAFMTMTGVTIDGGDSPTTQGVFALVASVTCPVWTV